MDPGLYRSGAPLDAGSATPNGAGEHLHEPASPHGNGSINSGSINNGGVNNGGVNGSGAVVGSGLPEAAMLATRSLPSSGPPAEAAPPVSNPPAEKLATATQEPTPPTPDRVLSAHQKTPPTSAKPAPEQAPPPADPPAPSTEVQQPPPTRENVSTSADDRMLEPPDDKFATPSALVAAPPVHQRTSKPTAALPPPSYSALVGGGVPGDPPVPYGALLGQRLRAMLPWQSADDPLTPILKSHKQVHPGGDVTLLRRAYGIAEQMHRGQMRKSGEQFITHPLAVTEILADLGMDTTTLVAALLHDTVEDTSYTLGALERDFGGEVALLVDGVTKFDKVFYGADAEVETIRKMIVAAGRDVRVLVIKLADRLHNMRTLDARSRASQVRIATATREVLIPLCDRLGIQALKRELEDWVLRAISPSGYALTADYVKHREGWDEYLERVNAAVSTELSKFKINAVVTPRPRHLYSIWKDTVNGNYTDPHDLPRVVIIVDGPETDCYAALGAVHGKWRPTPSRFKDFIASPKNNLYRSLHTTVLGPEGRPVEVLIRTEAMHRAAEFGIAANFRYPHLTARFGPATKAEQLAWLRRLLDWETAAADPAQFIASLRCDLSEAQILVFTTSGRSMLLPAEATPVDLAYILGADVGNRCIGARLNGRLISVSSPLSDGDTVEIITRAGQRDEFDFDEDAPARGPSLEWLEFVKTPHARLHIARWFEVHEAPPVTIANKVRLGRLAIGLALRQQGRGLASDLPLVRLAPRLGFPDLETLLVAVADRTRTAEEVVAELIALVDHSPHQP
jgi:guanosine-3',5'-bis(diphosphate) 3'-pyrophosphohydrolase